MNISCSSDGRNYPEYPVKDDAKGVIEKKRIYFYKYA